MRPRSGQKADSQHTAPCKFLASGDLSGQIDTSLTVTEAILKSCGMGFTDVTRATGYFKDGVGGGAGGAGGAGFGSVRQGVAVQADICRAELLFEIQLDAVG